MSLKESVKAYAYRLGADLVGFGSIERCAHAPPMMSPQGIYPGAKSVVVMALHHPDACIERGGERHPQDIGPYSVQYLMNSRLDEMAYRLSTFLEKQGYGAIPIASSNIWRYNEYKDLKAVFAPDLSHIYMAVVAGLADVGYSGLAITPEYGARNRFITVITDAEIAPDPLIPPGAVCDRCMLCRKHCPSAALSKEIHGEKVLKIESYEYRFPNKNLWRCAWGEHFDLDLDLPIPDQVTEQVIVGEIRKHGRRSGEMGQCLKFCVPKKIRSFDRGYSRTPMRKLPISLDEGNESRATSDRLLAEAHAKGAEYVVVSPAEELKGKGIDVEAQLPGAKSVVTLAATLRPVDGNKESARTDGAFRFGAGYLVDSLCYDLTRAFEGLGFRSVMTIGGGENDPGRLAAKKVVEGLPALAGRIVVTNSVITRKRLTPRVPDFGFVSSRPPHPGDRRSLTRALGEFARSLGADLVGVAPTARIEGIATQIRPHFDGRRSFAARDRSAPFTRWEPEISVETRVLRVPADYLPGARSVLVFGLRYHREVLRHATRPPAEAVGPYAFQTYVTKWLGWIIGAQLAGKLEEFGFRAVITPDLMNTASWTANPRGPQDDAGANRFAAVAAGLGRMTWNGRVATPEFGIRQRFIAIVTDADLEPTPVAAVESLCERCDRPCVAACPSHALLGSGITYSCGSAEQRMGEVDLPRCDWAKRYALLAAEGFGFLGSAVSETPGDQVTAEELGAALKKLDPIKKYRPVTAEPCVLKCPYANGE